MPLRSRHGYAADLHHGLPTGDITQPRSPPHDLRAGVHRSPAQIRQVRAGGLLLRGRSAAGSSRAPSRLACRTRTIWRCWHVPALSGLLPPIPSVPTGQAALSFNQPAATGRRRCPSITARSNSASWRSMSATHNWSGAGGVKLRSTRSGAGAACGSRLVSPRSRRRWQPWRPAAHISLATRLRPTCTSRPSRSSACTRGAP
jgi:hypothetical protein